MKKILLLIVSLCFFGGQSPAAEQLTILTENLPPLNYVENGELVGSSVEIVEEIQKRTGSLEPIQVYPWARAYKMALEEENIVLFGMTYTDDRSQLFKWVGPLATKRDILLARRDALFSITSLEDAKKVERIGTLRDDVRGKLLEKMGFTNLEPVSDEQKNAQKLALGRIDLWAYKKPGFRTVCKLAEVDPELFVEVAHLKESELKIAFSKKTSDAIVSRWQKAFADMVQDGTVQRIKDKWNID
ncbi:MAG: transporter substrate-binding domain-containing protein [Desulfofustis sp.]|jgi:polar amino acid transport system substrate-binding protein